jgi:hypothetical protein
MIGSLPDAPFRAAWPPSKCQKFSPDPFARAFGLRRIISFVTFAVILSQ